MSPPIKTLPHNHFAVVRVVRVLGADNETRYFVERRSRWWPFWYRASTPFSNESDAIAIGEAHLLVMDYLQRTVHEPNVVWKG